MEEIPLLVGLNDSLLVVCVEVQAERSDRNESLRDSVRVVRHIGIFHLKMATQDESSKLIALKRG
jgi:hypothetical protein